jgi:Zn-dependent protease
LNDLVLQFAVTLPALLVSLVFHEVSHGYVAYRLGDNTAKRLGRLSLNPIKHLDVFGTLVLFITFFSSGGQMLFGWAKPVPINPRQFKSASPQRGMMWVGAAGPAANLVIVAASSLVLEHIHISSELLLLALFRVFQLNVILMIFNLMPVPPLDGSRVLGGFLPPQAYMRWAQLDQYGMMFVLLFLFLVIGPLNSVFFGIITTVYRLFLPSLVL